MPKKSVSVQIDVAMDEHAYWNWDKDHIEKDNAVFKNLNLLPETQSFRSENLEEDEESDGKSLIDLPILKTRSLSEIYEICNVTSRNQITIKKHQEMKFGFTHERGDRYD